MLHEEGKTVHGHLNLTSFIMHENKALLTETGDFRKAFATRIGKVGILPFVSPELVDKHDPKEASDVWNLGLILYEMLNLRGPFDQKLSVSELQDAIREGQFLPHEEGKSQDIGELTEAML